MQRQVRLCLLFCLEFNKLYNSDINITVMEVLPKAASFVISNDHCLTPSSFLLKAENIRHTAQSTAQRHLNLSKDS